MQKINTLLRSLTIEDAELPSLRHEATPPCSPCKSPPFYGTEAFVFQPTGHPKQALIDGEIWPPIFKPEFVRSAKKMKPISTDVFVCTYPKCGTTWIQHICSQLMNNDYGPNIGKGSVAELCVTSPMIERMGGKFADNLKRPRLLKTHFNYANCPKSQQAKYIFAVRNPKDCLTSYFHHNKNFKIYEWSDGDFDTFFELFMTSQLGFGDYFEHLLSWLPHIYDENVLFIKYEDMFADLAGSIQKIGNFLGGRAAKIVKEKEHLTRIVAESQIEAMKKDQSRWFPGSVLHKPMFIRKGGSRDWKNHMSREQSDRLDALFRERMSGTIAENWWQAEMCWDEGEEFLESAEETKTTTYSSASNGFLPKLQITKVTDDNIKRNTSDFDDTDIYSQNVSRRDSFSSVCSSTTDRYALVPFFKISNTSHRKSLESLVSSGYNSIYSSLTSLN